MADRNGTINIANIHMRPFVHPVCKTKLLTIWECAVSLGKKLKSGESAINWQNDSQMCIIQHALDGFSLPSIFISCVWAQIRSSMWLERNALEFAINEYESIQHYMRGCGIRSHLKLNTKFHSERKFFIKNQWIKFTLAVDFDRPPVLWSMVLATRCQFHRSKIAYYYAVGA